MFNRRSSPIENEVLPPGQTMAIGAIAGIAIGLLSATAYNRAAEENRLAGMGRRRIQVVELFTLGLAVLAIIRQTAELARAEDKDR